MGVGRDEIMIRKTETVWLIMVERGPGRWVRTGPVYRRLETARSWVSFVRGATRAPVKVQTVKVQLVDGQPVPAAVERFSEEFNIDLS